MTNQTYLLRSVLNFMAIQDPNGDWDELDPMDATTEDLQYLLDTLTEWINDGLEITPRVQGYIDYLRGEIN